MSALFFGNPLVVVVGIALVWLCVYCVAELWYRWSFRRDARALAMRHAMRGHVPPRPLPPRPAMTTDTRQKSIIARKHAPDQCCEYVGMYYDWTDIKCDDCPLAMLGDTLFSGVCGDPPRPPQRTEEGPRG